MDESSDESSDSFDFLDMVDEPLTYGERKKKNIIDGFSYDDMYFMDIRVKIKPDYRNPESYNLECSDELYNLIRTEGCDFEDEQLRFKWLPKDIYELREIISSKLAFIMGTENGLSLGCLSYEDAFLIRKDILKTDVISNNLNSMKYNYIILSMPYKLINSRIEDKVRYIQRRWRVKSQIRQKINAAKIIQRAWISNKFNPKSKLCEKLLDNNLNIFINNNKKKQN